MLDAAGNVRRDAQRHRVSMLGVAAGRLELGQITSCDRCDVERSFVRVGVAHIGCLRHVTIGWL